MLCQLKSTTPLLLLIVLLCYYVSAETTSTTATAANNNNNNSSTKTTSTAATFVPHRFTSSNNITILHEVHDDDDDDNQQPKLVLNTHEVLPTKKSVKKKPYTLLEKTIAAELEKPRPLKEYELHPVTFDFNLGDLEDLETHDPLKKDELDVIIDPNVLRNEGILSDEAVDGGLSYTELPALLQDAVVGDDATVAKDATGLHVTIVTTTTSRTTAALIDNATTTTTTTAVPLLSLDLPTTITISPHIFKVLKTTKSKVKGRELLKKDAPLGFNSISRLAAHQSLDESLTNATAESWQSAVNQFQLLINLYDHFYWHPSDIRHKVTTGCGIEMQAYLTALNSNLEWAQRAYDASGRYRGQMFYGNDKWLGEKAFCYELNRQLKPEERKHFEFEFYVALVSIQIWLPGKLDLILQLGECLPKTCTPQDVQAILTLDPHAHMLMALNAANSTNPTQITIKRMRKVPGDFSYWLELKFQIFISFMFSLTALVIISTWYQAKLNRRKCATAANMTDMRAEVSTVHRSMGNGDNGYNGKAFELYQMSTLSDNNNVDIEADLNGNKNHQHQQQQQQHNTNSSCSNGSKRTETNGHSTVSSTIEKSSEAELKAQIAADYRIETCSSAGATGTYEAKQKLGLHQQVLLCFAFQTNASVIMNIDDNKESQTSCVHGLRVFSVLWTIMVHTYLQMFTIAENRFTRIIVERSIWYQFVGNATFSVDTFFFISGFLVTLLYLKQDKKYPEATGQFMRKSFVDTLVIVIYRYIRLTPAYLFVILFNDFSLRQTFDASVFQPTIGSDTCSGYWWRNILYINNFYPLSEICMIWSWYMANDMQFYIMASVLLVLSTRYFKAVALIVCTFLFSSWGLSGIISLHYNYTHKVANPFESFDFLYDKPWQRVGTYIMGMLAGYIFHKVKSPPKITSRTNLLLWAGSIGLLFIIIFGVWNGELNVISTAFYVSMGHTAFGLALIWIVLSCCWGFANPVNRVLSYRGLWPLSRLTYCTYLIHPLIMLLTSFRMEGTVHLNNLFVLTIFLGNAVVSFFVAFFISVLFEAPVIRLLKIFFRK